MGRNSRGYWDEKKEKLLRMYSDLSDKDLRFNVGHEEEMLSTLTSKLGKTRQELLAMIVML
jgi:hypothetical protein